MRLLKLCFYKLWFQQPCKSCGNIILQIQVGEVNSDEENRLSKYLAFVELFDFIVFGCRLSGCIYMVWTFLPFLSVLLLSMLQFLMRLQQTYEVADASPLSSPVTVALDEYFTAQFEPQIVTESNLSGNRKKYVLILYACAFMYAQSYSTASPNVFYTKGR